MTSAIDSFYVVRIDFGDHVRNLQYGTERIARIVLEQYRARYGHDAACMVQVHY